MKTIEVLSRVEAIQYRKGHGGMPEVPYAFISISDTEKESINPELSDYKTCIGFYPVAFADYIDNKYCDFPGQRVITEEQAEGIAKFIGNIWGKIDLLIVNCVMGVSRSAAIAKAIDEIFNGGTIEFNPPRFHPNPLVYSLVRKYMIKYKHRGYMPLYNADELCDHDIASASGGGVKCTKCNGWFCY